MTEEEVDVQEELESLCVRFEVDLVGADPRLLGILKRYIEKGVIKGVSDESGEDVITIKLSRPVSVFGRAEKTETVTMREMTGAEHALLQNSASRKTEGTSTMEVISKMTGVLLNDLKAMRSRDYAKLEVATGFLS